LLYHGGGLNPLVDAGFVCLGGYFAGKLEKVAQSTSEFGRPWIAEYERRFATEVQEIG
jgi:hypothetical protein